MRARVLKPFVDGKEGVTRNLGDTFTLSKERYDEINSTKFGALIEEVKPKRPAKKG